MRPERKWRLGIGADHIGADLKNALRNVLEDHPAVESLRDFGVSDGQTEVAYPGVALVVAEAIASGEIDRAVLVCGTGIGMAISANKVSGVRAAVAYDFYSVERSVLSNDSQVLALGSNVVGLSLAERIVDAWLGFVFDESSPSAAKIAEITSYETGRGHHEGAHSARTRPPGHTPGGQGRGR
jgi:ribose 5-phosphate isomerase B